MVRRSMPKRILVLSANMGEGHNAAARLIADAARQIWPGCEVRTLDTLELRGRRFSRACQSAYDFDLRRMPWLYQYFYASLIKHPWFAWASKRLVGSFFGRRLLGEVRRFRPDLVVSTYPLGSAAIDWARRARGLSRPTATFVPAFDIHPFWVYKGIDLNLVMHPALVEAFRATGVREQVLVGAPLVRVAFGPGDPVVARREVGLEPDRFVVLLTGGAWGVGSLERAVRELLAVDAPLQIVVVCGTNERLRARLEALKAPRDR